jgi:signal transduction histidine kinase/CheY-like chemotaxis protein
LEPGTFGGTFEAFVERIHPDDRESVLETVGKATKSGADFSVQNRALWPDGTIRWLTGAGRVHLGEHGAPVRGVGISLDVTERHTLEQQYRQAQKMEAIGQLAGGVAHDFNNLLTAILGYAALLAEEFAVGDPKRADIEEIRKAGERAAGLTRQLLAFSRQQVMQSTILDLNGLTNNLANMLRRLIGEHIELNLSLSSDLGSVKADPGQLEQVIMNLAVNARDAMALGGRLTVETANIELDDAYGKSHGIAPFSAGSFVMLAVSDTGIGMDEVTKRRIFEPFFTTKPRDQGTGLGLATVYGIVKQSGGYVWVYSEPGQGTTFKIYLPRIDEPAAALSEADVSKEVIDRGSETILLVEDEESVRVLSRILLERAGYLVLDAANPQEALATISGYAEPIDLLLTDVMMPGESGPELFRHLIAARPETRVLYISGYADQAIVSRGVLEAGVPFLQKPFSAAGLARKVREVLDSDLGRHT